MNFKLVSYHSNFIRLIDVTFLHFHACGCVLGEEEEEEEAAEEDDDDELRLQALDDLSSSPGKTGLSRADSDGLSPGEDADTKGETGIRER